MPDDRKALIEIGARTIYEFRLHPQGKPWAEAPAVRQADCRANMARLVAKLDAAGYEIQKPPRGR